MNIYNPFLITEPTVISFSGGRTSAYMLWRIIQAHDGILPDDAIVCFANTGKEDEATLKFVMDCEQNWNVPIHWLEYTSEKPKFKKVCSITASRNGEPFEAMINDKNMMIPNNFMRFCTQELKINTIRRYLKHICLDIDDDQHLVGIRADEQRRVAKVGLAMCPLAQAGITSRDVGAFWESNNFDLGLPKVGQNKLSNCDLCFMKGDATLASLIKDKPSRATWWINIENKAKEELIKKGKNFIPSFRKNSMSYEDMLNYSKAQIDMFSDESMACFCGD
jgi:3'-phosphoadenosine 5'-phosphosulfate sulfotransferase (PAPS reductase)/FAD synthetase